MEATLVDSINQRPIAFAKLGGAIRVVTAIVIILGLVSAGATTSARVSAGADAPVVTGVSTSCKQSGTGANATYSLNYQFKAEDPDKIKSYVLEAKFGGGGFQQVFKENFFTPEEQINITKSVNVTAKALVQGAPADARIKVTDNAAIPHEATAGRPLTCVDDVVGGVMVDPAAQRLPLEAEGPAGGGIPVLPAVVAGSLAVAFALGGAAWYGRRRWQR